MAREMFPGVYARQCPDCGMYCGKGAGTDLTPPCGECLEIRRDRARIAEEERIWNLPDEPSSMPCAWPDCGRLVGDCPHYPGSYEATRSQFESLYGRGRL